MLVEWICRQTDRWCAFCAIASARVIDAVARATARHLSPSRGLGRRRIRRPIGAVKRSLGRHLYLEVKISIDESFADGGKSNARTSSRRLRDRQSMRRSSLSLPLLAS